MQPKFWLAGFLIVVSLALAGCQSVQPQPGTGPSPLPTEQPAAEQPTPVPGMAEAELPPAALNMRQLLASQLGVDLADVVVLEAEPVEWPDACLGAGGPAELCAAVMTPGYRIVLEAQGGRYVYHTDPEAYRFRLVEAPEVNVGEPIIEWTGTSGYGECRTVVVGTEAISLAGCYSDVQMAGRLVMQQREDDLEFFRSTYAPFTATTNSGDVVFHGEGTQEATAAEQRMIGEWMNIVMMEADSGRSSAGLGFLFSVLREGGIAALCQNVSVYMNGIAYVADCAQDPIVTLPVVRLNSDQVEQVYRWYDTVQTFEDVRVDGVADVMTTTISFYSLGATPATDEDKASIEALAADLAASATEMASARVGGCPEAGEGQALYRNDALGYCLLYPSTHGPVEYSEIGTAFTVGGDLMNHVDARFDVEVSEADGSAADAADALLADVSAAMDPAERPRTVVSLGPVGAVVVDQIPGQDLRRILFAVHDGKLFTLSFTPSDPASEAYAAMEELYERVVESFSFTN